MSSMGSVDSVRKALEERQKRKEQQKNDTTVNGAHKSSVEEALNARRTRYASVVDESYINTFINDSNSFFTQAQTDWGNLSWESATNSESAKKRERNAADKSAQNALRYAG